MDTPVVFQYQRALDAFRREGREPPLLKRMSELISLLDLTTTLSSSLPNQEILDAALLIVMGELQARRGCMFVREPDAYVVRASRGLPHAAPVRLPPAALDQVRALTFGQDAECRELAAAFGLDVLCPVFKGDKAVAVLGLGPRPEGAVFGPEEQAFLRSVAACAATPIENGLMYDELKRVNQRLSVKVFQLHNLFDISRELTAMFDEEGIKELVTTTLMGHLMVSRCSMYLAGPEGLSLAHERGPRSDDGLLALPKAEADALLARLRAPLPAAELPATSLRERLQRQRLTLVVPMSLGGSAQGFLAVGDRPSGAAFSEEDGDFAMTLGRQALAALDNARLQGVRLEKQRRDRELQIAREIQQSLFPRACPAPSGFDLAADSRSCYEVGGDLFDFVELPGGRLALAIADVSGKGTPASILMASVHASLHALAGTLEPGALMRRLNRFLFESTQSNKYVTMFYGELDPGTRELRYVSAGHVPPYHLTAGGAESRLEAGGLALGLLEDAEYEVGRAVLEPGDVVLVVTDGATEALSPEDEEFGDARVVRTLRASGAGRASELLAALYAAVQGWTGARGCSDDLTALIVRAE